MRFFVRAFSGLVVLSISLALLAFAFVVIQSAITERNARDGQNRPARERVLAVNVIEAELDEHIPILRSFGEISSRRVLDIRAPEAGVVSEIGANVEEGGRVSAGDLLFRLDASDQERALQLALVDLQDAQAELRDAQRALVLAQDDLVAAQRQASLRQQALNRQRDLVSRRVGTDAAVEAAELASAQAAQAVLNKRQALAQSEVRLDLSRTQLKRRELARDEAQRRLEDTEIRADFDGILTSVSVVQGRRVTANELLAQKVDPAELEVSFRVSTTQFSRLLGAAGQVQARPVMTRLNADDFELTSPGHITRTSAAVGEGQTGRRLFATIDAPSGFRPGDFVAVEVEEPGQNAVARLPATALDSAGQVLIVNSQERIELLSVELVRRQDDWVLVRGPGLEGARVVAQRSPLLGAGIKVRALSPRAADVSPPEPPELISLDPAQRERLLSLLDNAQSLSDAAKSELREQLSQPQVPAFVVERIENRTGG